MTEEKILEGAHHLFYQFGIRSVTMDDIASHLGISKKTIYQYFPDKNSIVVDLNDKIMYEHECQLIEIKNNAKNAIEEILAIMSHLRKFVAQVHPSVFYDMQKYHKEAWDKYLDFKECCMIRMVEDNLQWGQQEGLYRKDMDINIIATMRMHQVQTAFDPNIFPPSKFKLEIVQMQMLTHFMHGITTLKGHKLINKFCMLTKMKTKHLLLLFISVFLTNSLPSFAQSDSSFTFSQAVEYAIQHNPQLNNLKLDVEIAEKQVNEYLAIGLPQVNASFEGAYNIEVPTNFLPDFLTPAIYGVLFNENLVANKDVSNDALFPVQFGATHTGFAGINASQLLFDGTYLVGLKATKSYVELAKRNNNVSSNDIKIAVAQSYYAVLILREQLELLKKNEERLNILYHDTKAMYENGFAEKIDADRIKVALNKLELETKKVERLLPVTEAGLKLNMGYPVSQGLILTDQLENSLLNIINFSAEKEDIQQRPEYQRMLTQINLAEYDLKRFRMAYLPRLELFGNISTTMASNNDWFFDTKNKWFPSSGVGIRASLPIFTSFQRKSRTDMAKLRLDQTKNGKYLLENSLQVEIDKARADLSSAMDLLKIEQENKELAAEIVRVSKIKFEQGVGSNLELINAETDFRESLTSYYNAIYNSILAKILYQKAIGKLSF